MGLGSMARGTAVLAITTVAGSSASLPGPPGPGRLVTTATGRELVLLDHVIDLESPHWRGDREERLDLGGGYQLVTGRVPDRPAQPWQTVVRLERYGKRLDACDLGTLLARFLAAPHPREDHAVITEIRYNLKAYDYAPGITEACPRRGNSVIGVLALRHGPGSSGPGGPVALVRITLKPFRIKCLRPMRPSRYPGVFEATYPRVGRALFYYGPHNYVADGDAVHEVLPDGRESGKLAGLPSGTISGLAKRRWILTWTYASQTVGRAVCLKAFDLASMRLRTLDWRILNDPSGYPFQGWSTSDWSPYVVMQDYWSHDFGARAPAIAVNVITGKWTRLPTPVEPAVGRYSWAFRGKGVQVYDLESGKVVQTLDAPGP